MEAKELVSTIKDAAAGVREVALVILLAVLLFNPPVLVGWLESSRLDKVGFFGISFEARRAAEASREQSLAAATQLQSVDERAKVAESKVLKLAQTLERVTSGSNPVAGEAVQMPSGQELKEIARQVETVRQEIASTRVATERAKSRSRSAVISQTRAVERAGGVIKKEGWIWVGQIDRSTGGLRNVGEPETVEPPKSLDPERLRGENVVMRAPTDLYSGPFDGLSPRTRIVGVVPTGKATKVIEARLVPFRRSGLPNRSADDQILWVRIAGD